MVETVISASVSFVATNIDDIFILMLFFAREERPNYKKYIVFGQYLGMLILILLSLVGRYILRFLPDGYIGFLGLIPVALGIREWISCRQSKDKGKSDDDEHRDDILSAGGDGAGFLMRLFKPEILQVALITLSNGADNLGVYTPLFAGYTPAETAVAVFMFLLLLALWCLIGIKLASLPILKAAIARYKHILVPVVFMALGIYILLDSGLFGWF